MEYLFKNFEFLFVLIISFLINYTLIFLGANQFKHIFPLVKSSSKTALFHSPLIRGVGVFYLIPVFIFWSIFPNIFEYNEIILIFITTMLGFFDDKFNLSQKFKLLFLIIIFLVFSLLNDFSPTTLFLNLFLFVLLILFFNQIDGINGICSITFLIFLLLLFFDNTKFSVIYEISLILIGSILAYLNFNIRGKGVIQGDSGSYFLGTMAFILSVKTYGESTSFFMIILILPLLLDVSITTLTRLYLKKSVLTGHKDNIYQKFAIKFNDPLKITFLFIIIQLITGAILIYSKNNFDIKFFIITFIILLIILTIKFIFLQFLTNKENTS